MEVFAEIPTLLPAVCLSLSKQNVSPQVPATFEQKGYDHLSYSPPTEGFCRLIDGTIIWAAGTQNVGGDPFQRTIEIGENTVFFNAVGIAAVRLGPRGEILALAAGGLRDFVSEQLEIHLEDNIDVALWREESGKFRGVIQGHRGFLPATLSTITDDWMSLSLPQPLSDSLSEVGE